MSTKMNEEDWGVGVAGVQPRLGAKALYRGRARIEQMMAKLKRFKRVALRCEKTARNFRSVVALAATFILRKSVRTG